jgi:hypothetical protein
MKIEKSEGIGSTYEDDNVSWIKIILSDGTIFDLVEKDIGSLLITTNNNINVYCITDTNQKSVTIERSK